MTESDFVPGRENFFTEMMRQRPDDKELHRLLDWKMEYEAIEALQSPKQEDVLKASEEFIKKVYEEGIDPYRSPFTIRTVYGAIPPKNWSFLTTVDQRGLIPLIEITRKFRQEKASAEGASFDPENPSPEDLKLIEETSLFKFEPLTIGILTGIPYQKIEAIQKKLPPLDKRQEYIHHVKFNLHRAGLLSYSVFESMPIEVPLGAKDYLKRVFMRQFHTLEQTTSDTADFDQIIARITYNCLALGTWMIGENDPPKEKALNPAFLPESLEKVDIKRYLERLKDEISGKARPRSMADYGAKIALQEAVVDMITLMLGREGGYYAVSLSPFFDDSKIGKRGGDVGLVTNGELIAIMDLTGKSSKSADKTDNPSGTRGELPVIVFPVAGLRRPYIDEKSGKLKYMPYTVRIQVLRERFRAGKPFPAFEGLPENIVWEFRRQFASRMRNSTDELVKDRGEERFGRHLDELRVFILKINSG